MSHLLLMSVGPVQDFIATARTCQDLWFGSRLLSDLAEAVAKVAEEAAGAESLIFPGELTHKRPSVANKILVAVDADGAVLAKACRKAAEAHLRALYEHTLGRLESKPHFRSEVARKQLDGLVEFDWVVVDAAAGYEAARGEAEGWLAAAKNARPWAQPTGSQAGPRKCSVCGARDSVIAESAYKAEADTLWSTFRVGGAERLCAVDLMKRWGREDSAAKYFENRRPRPDFHSTSHLAASGLLLRAADAGEALKAHFDALADGADMDRQRAPSGQPLCLDDPLGGPSRLAPRAFKWEKQPVDGRLLYRGQLRAILKDERGDAKSPFEESDLVTASSTLGAALSALGCAEPFAYYAFLLADGDKMGQAIEGLKTRDAHRALSKALEEFSQGTRDIVDEHQGSLIYAGGDDVLAVLPVHTAVQCAAELAKSFSSKLMEAPGLEALRGMEPPTLSVGLAFVHHLSPMTHARKVAKAAEVLGKTRKPERNALAIIFDPRGGDRVEWRAQWSPSDPLDARLWRWARYFLEEKVPHGTPFHLLDDLAPLRVGDKQPAPNVVQALARRVLLRRANLGEAVREQLSPLIDGCTSVDAVEALANELLIGRLLAESYRKSWGDPPRTETEEVSE